MADRTACSIAHAGFSLIDTSASCGWEQCILIGPTCRYIGAKNIGSRPDPTHPDLSDRKSRATVYTRHDNPTSRFVGLRTDAEHTRHEFYGNPTSRQYRDRV